MVKTRYTLYKISDDSVIRHDYFEGAAPTLAAEKGVYWGTYVEPEPVAPTAEEVINKLTWAVQVHLDEKAREKNYDNIVSACSYAAVPNVFQAESAAFLSWRASVWAACYTIMAEVQNQTRAVPTAAELIAELPALVLPS
jgi:hypothetical protein